VIAFGSFAQVSPEEAATGLRGRSPVWTDIRRDGQVVNGLAIHVGINAAAADAVCGARLGRRAAGEDHDQVLGLLRQAGPDGAEVARDLRRLLPLKSRTEYAPDDIAPSVAAKAVERANRCSAVAQRVAATTR